MDTYIAVPGTPCGANGSIAFPAEYSNGECDTRCGVDPLSDYTRQYFLREMVWNFQIRMGLKIDSESGFGELLNSERELILYIAFYPSNNA
jgi:hypothetical protein